MKRLLPVIIPLLTIIILLIVFSILKTNPVIAEWWTMHISNGYYFVINWLTKYIPFSLTEVFFVSLFVFIVILIIKFIKDFIKKDWIGGVKKIGIIATSVLSVICVYSLCCEMAYNRKPIDLPFYQEEVENSEFKNIYNYYANDLNECANQFEFTDEGDLKHDHSYVEISKKVHESFAKNIDSDYYYKVETNAKPMLSSFIYRELNITGVTFAPFVEANVDYLSTNLELPLVIAHEIAHTKGVMREDDANQFAFYLCLNSDDPYLRLSAYGLYFYQLTLLTGDDYMSTEDQNSLVDVDINYYRARRYMINYWKKHQLLKDTGQAVNNAYINSSGVPEGTDSYQGGTEVTTDPVTMKLVPSQYQSLFFTSYYQNK